MRRFCNMPPIARRAFYSPKAKPIPMFMTHIKYETGSLQALFNGQQFVWVFYDAVGPFEDQNRTSLPSKSPHVYSQWRRWWSWCCTRCGWRPLAKGGKWWSLARGRTTRPQVGHRIVRNHTQLKWSNIRWCKCCYLSWQLATSNLHVIMPACVALYWQTERLTGWLVDWLTSWLVDRLHKKQTNANFA